MTLFGTLALAAAAATFVAASVAAEAGPRSPGAVAVADMVAGTVLPTGGPGGLLPGGGGWGGPGGLKPPGGGGGGGGGGGHGHGHGWGGPGWGPAVGLGLGMALGYGLTNPCRDVEVEYWSEEYQAFVVERRRICR